MAPVRREASRLASRCRRLVFRASGSPRLGGWTTAWWVGVVLASVASAGLYLVLETRAFYNLHFGAVDYGLYDNTIWNVANGRGFHTSVYGISYLAIHFSPILALVAPLYWVWDTPMWPIIVQCGALAASGILLAMLARHLQVRPVVTLALLATYFFELLAQRVYLVEFHTVAIQAPFVFAFVLSTLSGHHVLAAVWAGLLLATREDAFVGLAPLALFLAWRLRTWVPAATGLIALVYGWWAIVFAMPLFGGTTVFQFRAHGFRLFRGARAFLDVLDAARFAGAYLLVPHAVLVIFAGAWLLVAVPPLLQVFLSGYPAQYLLQVHYSASLRPYLFLAMTAGLATVTRRTMQVKWGGWLPHAAVGLSAAIALLLVVRESPMPPFPMAHSVYGELSPRYRYLYELIGRLPATAAVAAPDHVFPHVAHRAAVWRYRGPDSLATPPEYCLLDAGGGAGRLTPGDLTTLVTRMGYGLEAVSERFALLGRGRAPVRFEDYRELFYVTEVERTARRIGDDVRDATASGGVARRAVNPGELPAFVSFGRSWPLPAGDQVCRARVRKPSPALQASGYLEAVGSGGRVLIARRPFRLDRGGDWVKVELAFSLAAERDVEIRIAVDAGSALAADAIELDGPALRAAFEALFAAGGSVRRS